MKWQLALHPGIRLPEQDVRVQKQREPTLIPSFEETRSKLEQGLVEQRTGQALDRWLGDTRMQVEIRFHEGAFQ